MLTLTPRKSGVLGVLCVPESLQPNNGEAFGFGTPSREGQNTRQKAHTLCSSPTPCQQNTAGLIEQHQHHQNRNTTRRLFLPAGRSLLVRHQQPPKRFGAVIQAAHWGVGE